MHLFASKRNKNIARMKQKDRIINTTRKRKFNEDN